MSQVSKLHSWHKRQSAADHWQQSGHSWDIDKMGSVGISSRQLVTKVVLWNGIASNYRPSQEKGKCLSQVEVSFQINNLCLPLLTNISSANSRLNKKELYKNTVAWRREVCLFGVVGGRSWGAMLWGTKQLELRSATSHWVNTQWATEKLCGGQ